MQFVENGPDIPEQLLRAHEEGSVVFFCGAGISYPAGLPGFGELVNKIYCNLGTRPNPTEKDAYDRKQYDATLNLLELRYPGGRLAVRSSLNEILKPKLKRKGAKNTHEALLRLSTSHDGALRLVTTNFDRIFHRIMGHTKSAYKAYPAPLLPIPKNSKWDGLVYLHGLLPKQIDEKALNRLVLTSGDFGLAYLTERWAARFVSELFRNYVVCFVGYSINDPVLRYMMDALAADRILGENTPQAYALGDFEPNQKISKTKEWEAKGVKPILYEVPLGSNDHSAMHGTLKVWAETYSDGTLGKERIVLDYALARPSASTQQDDFVGRMVWALSHKSGLPAKRFANHKPTPPYEWLEAFYETRYKQADLNQFGILPNEEKDEKLQFSLVCRPTPYTLAPLMSLSYSGLVESRWDPTMFYLARWLTRHLNDPRLIIWLVRQGGELQGQLASMVERELDKFAELNLEGNIGEIKKIKADSPNAIPEPLMNTLWRLLIAGKVKSEQRKPDFYRWTKRLKREGLTTILRIELRDILAPKITIKKPFLWSEDDAASGTSEYSGKVINYELVLEADHVHSTIRDMAEYGSWGDALPLLLDDFQKLLLDALDLLHELDEGDYEQDSSHWDLPSILSHWQNRGFKDWVSLIELLRDAWLAVFKTNPKKASQLAQQWFCLPYSTFKRLAFFAASHDDCISSDQYVSWLLIDDSYWLWSSEIKRELMRLLVQQGNNLSSNARAKLETAILSGPPRTMYREDLELEQRQSIVDHAIWLRLAKLQSGGSSLSNIAFQRFNELSKANQEWKLASDERDEFSHWMSGTGDIDYESSRKIDIAPRKRSELVIWLKQPQSTNDPFYEDTWRETCRTRFFHCFCALLDLAKEDQWPSKYWREALQVWSEESITLHSRRFVTQLLEKMPEGCLQEITHSIAWWINKMSKSLYCDSAILLHLSRRILDLRYESSESAENPVTMAINHPIGLVAEALLNLWFKLEPNDNDLLPYQESGIFSELCNTKVEHFRHGRVLLASRLIALFRVDRPWTEEYLLPLFDWSVNPEEAKVVWEGFLWSPRLYQPLLSSIKAQFLNTANHYIELGEYRRHFATFLTYAALSPHESYTSQDYQSAISALPEDGLQEVAQTLSQALGGAGEKREYFWENRIQPFWQQVWPKSNTLVTSNIAEPLARLCISAHEKFPSAVSVVQAWLVPIEHPDYIISLLKKSGLSERYPESALTFLSRIIDGQNWMTTDLRECLKAISKALPSLAQDSRFCQLEEHARQSE